MNTSIDKRNWIIISFLLCFGAGIYSIVQRNPLLVISAIVFCLIITFFCNTSYKLYSFLIYIYFFFDQISIDVGGSTFKVYFIISLLILFLSVRNLNAIFSSNVLRNLLLWLFVCLALNLYNGGGIRGIRTFLGIILQALSTFVIFLLLYQNKIDLEQLEKILFTVIKVGLIFGFVQYFIYILTGITLGLNQEVVSTQLLVGQIPSFRYEGNTYGKLVSWGILFLLPQIVRNSENRKEYIRWLWISIAMQLISITRAAMYAMLVALALFLIVSIIQKRFNRIIGIVLGVLLALLVALMLISSGVISLGNYNLYKIQNFFIGTKDVASDGSASYRLFSMNAALDIWRSNFKNLFIGVGYAQATGDLTSVGGQLNAELGGGDIVTLTVSFGIVGILLYIKNYISIMFSAIKRINSEKDYLASIWIERILYLYIYAIVLECLSGCMLCPEFWMTFGIAAYVLGNYFSNV